MSGLPWHNLIVDFLLAGCLWVLAHIEQRLREIRDAVRAKGLTS
jgi:hypothetical protein